MDLALVLRVTLRSHVGSRADAPGLASARAASPGFGGAVRPAGILSNRFVSAKLLPLDEQGGYGVLMRVQTDAQAEELPVPPLSLSSRWGLSTESYLRGGQIDAETVLAHLAEVEATVEPGARVLDFGCAEGRILRSFPRHPESELWGVDIDAGSRSAWAQRHLPAPFRFRDDDDRSSSPVRGQPLRPRLCHIRVHPHQRAGGRMVPRVAARVAAGRSRLPPHAGDRRRRRAPARRAYRDNPTHAYMVDLVRKFGEATRRILDQEWAYFTILADPAAQVFYDAAYLVDKWSRLADCVRVTPEAIGYQTALIFRKSPR